MKDKIGMIHIYCGEGKGKTTAAIGLALRAAGYGKRVQIFQFLKNRQTGEYEALKKISNIRIEPMEIYQFVHQMNEREIKVVESKQNQTFIQFVRENFECDLLILDEVFGAVETKTFSLDLLLDFLKEKPPGLEVVLTGRKVPASLLPYADYISRIECIRHPYMKGISARIGIEK